MLFRSSNYEDQGNWARPISDVPTSFFNTPARESVSIIPSKYFNVLINSCRYVKQDDQGGSAKLKSTSLEKSDEFVLKSRNQDVKYLLVNAYEKKPTPTNNVYFFSNAIEEFFILII